MGALQDLRTGERIPLAISSRVGRGPDCALVLQEPWVSRDHAVLAWTGDGWELRDLGSHNGTWVDGARLAPGARRSLALGAELAFGQDARSHRLVDVDPPEPMAREEGGGWRVGQGGLLDLSEAGGPPVLVLRGADGGWLLEEDGRSRPVQEGEALDLGGRRLALRLPGEVARTVPAGAEAEPAATFHVSLDEEEVRLVFVEDGREVDLGVRSHHYLLLTLARQRLLDAARPELPPPEQGWVDAEHLGRQLRLEPRYLNVLVHRARKQAAEAGLRCAHRLVERRDLARQLRLGLSDPRVTR